MVTAISRYISRETRMCITISMFPMVRLTEVKSEWYLTLHYCAIKLSSVFWLQGHGVKTLIECGQTVNVPFAVRSNGQATKTMVKIFWPRLQLWLRRKWKWPPLDVELETFRTWWIGWALFGVNFRPLQGIEAIMGSGRIFDTGPFFTRLWY